MEVTGWRWRRRTQLLDYLKERRECWKLKEETLDRTLWRTRLERSHWTVVRLVNKGICMPLEFSATRVSCIPRLVWPHLWRCDGKGIRQSQGLYLRRKTKIQETVLNVIGCSQCMVREVRGSAYVTPRWNLKLVFFTKYYQSHDRREHLARCTCR
jgi:hypothetical protein